MSDQGWRFAEGADTANGATYMHEIYTRADPHFTGRATVPVLWDKKRGTIVNNESADILRIFNSGFGASGRQRARPLPRGFARENRRLERPHLPAPQQRRLSRGIRDDAGRLRRSVRRRVRSARRIGAAPERRALSVRRPLHRDRHPRLRHAGALRRRLSRPLQMQSPAHRRLSQSQPLSPARSRHSRRARDGLDRPHQARLLFDQGAQPQRHRAEGAVPAAGPRRLSRGRWRRARRPRRSSARG